MSSGIKIQKNITLLAILLFIIKIIAWQWTKSIAIFTDAMESTVNVAAGFLGWYSLWLSAKPRDENHPYGHGKVEFITAAIEGTLILVAGLVIIYEAIIHLQNPHQIKELNWGLILLAITAIINYFAGTYAVKAGIHKRSIALETAGIHLKTDTYSTLGILLGLIVMWFTKWYWLDFIMAFVMAAFIIYTGYKVIRKSLAGIMDEADLKLLKKLVDFLEANRHPAWIDIHNLRMVQYGAILHLDGHITLPWYFTVKQAHNEIEELNQMIEKEFGNKIELFLHADYCEDFSCKICSVPNCSVRKHPQEKHIIWTIENVLKNEKHHL